MIFSLFLALKTKKNITDETKILSKYKYTILLVGSSCCGKTSFTNCCKVIVFSEKTMPTYGTDISQLNYNIVDILHFLYIIYN